MTFLLFSIGKIALIAILETCSRLPINQWYKLNEYQNKLADWSFAARFGQVKDWANGKTSKNISENIGALFSAAGRVNDGNWKARGVAVFLMRKLAG